MKTKYWYIKVRGNRYPCIIFSDGSVMFYSKEIPALKKENITREDVRKHIEKYTS